VLNSKAILESPLTSALELRESNSKAEVQTSGNSVPPQVFVIRGSPFSSAAVEITAIEITRRERNSKEFYAHFSCTMEELVASMFLNFPIFLCHDQYI
jgi:hypothetical protein